MSFPGQATQAPCPPDTTSVGGATACSPAPVVIDSGPSGTVEDGTAFGYGQAVIAFTPVTRFGRFAGLKSSPPMSFVMVMVSGRALSYLRIPAS